jgi:hypothetical protein
VRKHDISIRDIKDTPEKLLQSIRAAYNRLITTKGKHCGEKLLLTEVLREFVIMQQSQKFLIDPQKSNYQEYSRVKLCYVLHCIKKANITNKDMHLHVATFDATADKLHSMWIPENEEGEGTHYSHISFEKTPDA